MNKHSPDNKRAKSRRFIAYRELKPEKGIPYSRVWIDELIRQGKFPKKIRISANRVGWFDDDIDAHLDGCAAERDTSAA